MAITATPQSPALEATSAAEPRSGSLADVLDVILDKGIVVDAFVRVSLVGIEILTLDARIVIASVDTYMHFAREAHRLEMGGGGGSAKQGLAGMMGKLAAGGAEDLTRGALRGAGEGLREGLLPGRKKTSEDRPGVVQRAVGAIKDKAGEAIRDAITPGDGEDEGNEGASTERSQGQSGPSPPEPRPSRRRQPTGESSRGSQAIEAGSGVPQRARRPSGESAPPSAEATPPRRPGRRAAPPSRQAPPRGPED